MNRHQNEKKIIQNLNWFQNKQKLSILICDQQSENSDIITEVILNDSSKQNTQSTRIYLYWDRSQYDSIQRAINNSLWHIRRMQICNDTETILTSESQLLNWLNKSWVMFYQQNVWNYKSARDMLVKAWILKSWNKTFIWKDIHMKVIVQYEWRSVSRSLRIYEWKSQAKIHKIIKIISRIFSSVCVKIKWKKMIVCWL